jgi:hypothetical protein
MTPAKRRGHPFSSEQPGTVVWVGAKHSAPPGFVTRYMILIALHCGDETERLGNFAGHSKAQFRRAAPLWA